MSWWSLDELDVFPTLGYDVADWMTEFLLRPDADDLEAFVPTQEEIEFLAGPAPRGGRARSPPGRRRAARQRTPR